MDFLLPILVLAAAAAGIASVLRQLAEADRDLAEAQMPDVRVPRALQARSHGLLRALVSRGAQLRRWPSLSRLLRHAPSATRGRFARQLEALGEDPGAVDRPADLLEVGEDGVLVPPRRVAD